MTFWEFCLHKYMRNFDKLKKFYIIKPALLQKSAENISFWEFSSYKLLLVHVWRSKRPFYILLPQEISFLRPFYFKHSIKLTLFYIKNKNILDRLLLKKIFRNVLKVFWPLYVQMPEKVFGESSLEEKCF